MNELTSQKKLNSSFRDPSGFLFTSGEVLYRQVNKSYSKNYDLLMSSGLYSALVTKGLLISHTETDLQGSEEFYKIIRPEKVPFISYPYEWSFSMLKDAALATLEIQKIAMDYGMVLKDASAYNIQFINAKPIFIDTLSFEEYKDGSPWVAYQQFCRHFLAPLSLMTLRDVRLNRLSALYIDGIPLDLATKLLPLKAKFNPGFLMHILLHSRSQQNHAVETKEKVGNLSKTGLLGIIDNLHSTINSLKFAEINTEWGNYYSETNYDEESMKKKLVLVEDLLMKTSPTTVWDLGANNGRFSRLASNKDINTVAFDIDPIAVESNYLECKSSKDSNLLPLFQDLTNPTSGVGFSNNERLSLLERGPADTLMALALIHHLSISNNLSFEKTARFFSSAGKNLIIEFVPKEDTQVQRLLSSREDIFHTYDSRSFEESYSVYFDIIQKVAIEGTKRSLYLMRSKK